MPPNNKKKKAGRNNKKKGPSTAGGVRQNVNNNTVASTGRTADDAGTTSQATLLRRIPKLPTFRGKTEVHATTTAGSGGGGGYYEIYKHFTTRFWEWMKQALPTLVLGATNFIRSFFEGMEKSRYTFFVEQEEVLNVTKRNPLEGSYAYGRTGRTIQDPLPGFCVFKYSKAGKPDVRVIKPGKYTPFRPTADGGVESPYEVPGSKMRRQPSGKYRHIASYNMEELVRLGWDGAMYCATRGRHAANGHYVPYIPGYDSDADDEYEAINNPGCQNVGQIRNAR